MFSIFKKCRPGNACAFTISPSIFESNGTESFSTSGSRWNLLHYPLPYPYRFHFLLPSSHTSRSSITRLPLPCPFLLPGLPAWTNCSNRLPNEIVRPAWRGLSGHPMIIIQISSTLYLQSPLALASTVEVAHHYPFDCILITHQTPHNVNFPTKNCTLQGTIVPDAADRLAALTAKWLVEFLVPHNHAAQHKSSSTHCQTDFQFEE